jgi:hypothetical protein
MFLSVRHNCLMASDGSDVELELWKIMGGSPLRNVSSKGYGAYGFQVTLLLRHRSAAESSSSDMNQPFDHHGVRRHRMSA